MPPGNPPVRYFCNCHRARAIRAGSDSSNFPQSPLIHRLRRRSR